MNDNYLEYNHLGILKNSQLQEVSQGNHNVDYYYITYDEYDYTDGFVTVSCTLPDGTSFPELSTSPKDFEFGGQNYKGFMFVLRDVLTSQAGVLSMTFNLKSIENNTQLCSSRLNITIHESDTATEPTITQAQFDYMQDTIRENHNDLTEKVNDAVKKAEEALYHDATIVKINGEVQTTWDATFSQKLYDETYHNMFDINQTPTRYYYSASGEYTTEAEGSVYYYKYLQIPTENKPISFYGKGVKLQNTIPSVRITELDENRNFLNRTIYQFDSEATYIHTPKSSEAYYYDIRIDYYVGESYFDIFSLTYGETAYPNAKFHGEIIHKGDIKPTELFDGATTSGLTLTDDVENYYYAKIFYDVGNSMSQNSIEIRVDKLLLGDIILFDAEIDNTNPNDYGMVNCYKRITLRGKTLSVISAGRWWKYMNGGEVIDQQDRITIHKILGFKEV